MGIIFLLCFLEDKNIHNRSIYDDFIHHVNLDYYPLKGEILNARTDLSID
jgi:hypothetical protein